MTAFLVLGVPFLAAVAAAPDPDPRPLWEQPAFLAAVSAAPDPDPRPLWEQPAFLAAVATAPDPDPFPHNAPTPHPLATGAGEAFWAEIDSLINAFQFLPDVSFSVGDVSGRRHTFEKGKRKMDTRGILASSSKFPAALAIAGVVAAGHLSFETPAREVFSWWTRDPTDQRFGVTLRHLLTFSSGMVSEEDPGAAGIACLAFPAGVLYTPQSCAKQIFETGPWRHPPGVAWSYHSLHLQLAGAMACEATGLPMKEMLETYLLHKLGMRRSFWLGYPNPHLAAAMVSTGDDYDALLRGVLDYSVANKSTVDELERDAFAYYAPALQTAPDVKDQGILFYGHYSMCWFFECISQQWSDKCRMADVHSDPGALGYWPLINRRAGYYMQIVVMRVVRLSPAVRDKYHVTPAMELALSAQCVSPLRFQLQDPVEKALGTHAGPSVQPAPLPEPFATLCAIAASEAAA